MKRKSKIIVTVLFSLFLIVLFMMLFGKTKLIDSSVYNFIISFRNGLLDNYFRLITKLGNVLCVIIILILFNLFFGEKKALPLYLCAGTSVLINQGVKALIKRDRPSVERLIVQGGYSFPSGHAMISVCLYGYLVYFVSKNVKNKIFKLILEIVLIFLIISICISRIYVGVHYFSDIIAGVLLGLCILISLIDITNKYIRGN